MICGSTTHRIDKLVPVADLLDELVTGAEQALNGMTRTVPAMAVEQTIG